MSELDVPYCSKGKHGEALNDFRVLVLTGQIQKYPLFWREFACQLFEDIDDVQKELQVYKNELSAACEHVERLCEERTKLRKVVKAARDTLAYMDPLFRTTQRLRECLKEYDGEK